MDTCRGEVSRRDIQIRARVKVVWTRKIIEVEFEWGGGSGQAEGHVRASVEAGANLGAGYCASKPPDDGMQ